MNEETPIDVEAIMQEIRAEILAQRAAARGAGPPVSAVGKRFSPAFYEHLYQAGLAYDQIKPERLVRPVPVPVLGPVLGRLRQMLHELVLFYVNQVAAAQIRVNTHLLQALNALAQDLEEPDA